MKQNGMWQVKQTRRSCHNFTAQFQIEKNDKTTYAKIENFTKDAIDTIKSIMMNVLLVLDNTTVLPVVDKYTTFNICLGFLSRWYVYDTCSQTLIGTAALVQTE